MKTVIVVLMVLAMASVCNAEEKMALHPEPEKPNMRNVPYIMVCKTMFSNDGELSPLNEFGISVGASHYSRGLVNGVNEAGVFTCYADLSEYLNQHVQDNKECWVYDMIDHKVMKVVRPKNYRFEFKP